MKNELQQCVDFILEIEKLKTIYRQTYTVQEGRQENDTEHSWHLAMMAILLADFADEPVDMLKVVKMVLIHDIVEIDAGDTYCYDDEEYKTKAIREQAAARRIFGMLPSDKGEPLKALWEEFEECVTSEARFASALDRFQPLLLNIARKGQSWHEHGITSEKVYKRNEKVGDISKSIGDYIFSMLDDAVEKGYLPK
jgi:putative hydrolase of HD superfamily